MALAGWTFARTFMIAPPMMIVGVPVKQAFLGAAFASGLISVFTLLRLFNARNQTPELGRTTAYRRRALRSSR